MKELIDKRIDKIEISDSQLYIRITCEGTPYYYYAANDCCNSVWFSDFIGIDNLLGMQITDVQDIEVDLNVYPYPEGYGDDCNDSYGIRLYTQKGSADVIFRNSHNGYYGGSCVYMTKEHFEDTAERLKNSYRNHPPEVFKEYTNDYPYTEQFDGEIEFEV